MRLIIAKIGDNQTVSFAVSELIRLIKKMDETVVLDVRKYAKYDQSVKNALWVGLGFTEESEKDTIYINVKNSVGTISGSNERSVLISVYRFMKELGCRYLRPGKYGEKIPKRKLDYTDLTVNVKETASYNHRGICIEGSVGYEHVYNMIDWMPKVGMNEYEFQFFTPSTFFKQYYRHFGDEPSDNEVDAIVRMLDEDISKRSLRYHAVGHGWTCAPFGLGASGWDKYEGEPPKEIKDILALVDGERKFHGDIPLNTNLCYSNPYVREKIVDSVVEYCKNNPHKNYVAFCMADGENNHCECENCKKKIPSDFMALILNSVDEKLTELGINSKIVFPLYNDLMWMPENEKITNPDRYVISFAPISRSYSVSYADIDLNEKVEIEPYVRNKNVMISSLPKSVAILKKWKEEQVCSDSFLFDYHLMWDHHYDPGYYSVAKMLQRDMASLDKIGVDGMISCQIQRTAFPTALPLYCMAETLWNKNKTFDEIAKEYFSASFGEYADVVEDYMSCLSELFEPEILRGDKPFDTEIIVPQYQKAKAVIDEFNEKYIKDRVNESKDWEYLSYHAELAKIYADAYIARFLGNEEECKAHYERFEVTFAKYKESTDVVLDEFLSGTMYNNLFGWRKKF